LIAHYLDLLVKDLKAKQDMIIDCLKSNAVKDMEQYRLLNGKLQGLEESIIIARELYNAMVQTSNIS
jgi:hypothetical protein